MAAALKAPDLPDFEDDEMNRDTSDEDNHNDDSSDSVMSIPDEQWEKEKVIHDQERKKMAQIQAKKDREKAKKNAIDLLSDEDDDEHKNDEDQEVDMVDVTQETDQDYMNQLVHVLSKNGVNDKILQNLMNCWSLVLLLYKLYIIYHILPFKTNKQKKSNDNRNKSRLFYTIFDVY